MFKFLINEEKNDPYLKGKPDVKRKLIKNCNLPFSANEACYAEYGGGMEKRKGKEKLLLGKDILTVL